MIDMPSVNIPVPKLTAPTVQFNAPTVNIPSPVIKPIGVPSLNVPSLSAPSLKLNTSIPSVNIPSVGGLKSAFGGATSLTGGLNAAGLKAQLPNVTANIKLPPVKFPTPPKFPIGPIGLTLGAGPKFLTETFVKYKAIVPKFIPGVTINTAMVGGALTVLKALSAGNPAELLKQITKNFAEDLKAQAGGALDSSGLNAVKDQINSAKDQINSVKDQVSNIENSIESAKNEVTSVTAATADIGSPLNTGDIPPSTNPATNLIKQTTSTINSKISSMGTPPTG